MGYDINRFCEPVDEELICPICVGVLEDPLQAPTCEHAFCKRCIYEWLNRQPVCPVDRQTITQVQLRPVARILKNLLSRLTITCENQVHGCTGIFKLETLSSHLTKCEHNPKKLVPCEQGCGLVVPKDEVKDHNCVKELRVTVQKQKQKINDLQNQLSEHRFLINELRRETSLLKEYMKVMRLTNPSVRAIVEEIERDEIVRWSNSLTRAKVSRWGGMISTPDEYLQSTIKFALIESGCPPHILDDLMENCHERNWPPGLSSLETRQSKRREYEKYVCRRIPCKQAVVVLQVDNPLVDEDMMSEPGLVMIFAHGVE